MASDNEELIHKYVDRTGIASDTKFFLEQLNSILSAMNKINEIKISFGKVEGQFEGAKIAREAAIQQERIAAANKKLDESFQKSSQGAKLQSASLRELIEVAAKNELAMKSLAKSRRDLNDAFNAGALTSDEYLQNLSDIKEQEIQLSVSSEQVNKAIKNIEKNAQSATGSLDELKSALARAEQAFSAMSDAEKQSAAGRELIEKIKELDAAIKSQASGNVKIIESQRELDKAIIESKFSKQQYNKELKNEIELQTATANSIEKARAEIKVFLAERNKLNLATEEGRARQQELNTQIDAANDFIRENVDTLSKQKINIGNYQGSAKIIVDALKDVENEISSLIVKQKELQQRTVVTGFGKVDPQDTQALTQVTAQIGFLSEKQKALQGVTEKKQFLQIAGNVGDASKEIRFFTQRLIELEQAGLKDSQVFKDMQARLASLTDQVGDAKAEIKALSSDTRSFDLFAGSVNFAADAFQTAAGAAALFGASEEDAAKATRTLVAIQSVSNGVKGIANELTTKGTAANKVFAFVQGLVATSFDKTATAATRAKAALGLFALAATVIGGIVIAFAQYNKKLSETAQKQKDLDDAIKESKQVQVDAIATVQNLKNNIELAKKGFIDKKDVVKQYNDTIGKTTGEVKDLDEAERALAKNADAYIQFTLKKAAANILLQKSAELLVDATIENAKAEDRIKNLRPAREGDKEDKGLAEFLKSGLENERRARKAAQDKRVDNLKNLAKQFNEEAAKIATEFKFDFFQDGPEKDDKTKKNVQDEAEQRLQAQRKADLELFKDRQRRVIEENKKIVENEFFSAEVRIEALKKIATAENSVNAFQASVDLSRKGILAAEKIKIEEDYAEKVLKVNEELNSKTNTIQVQAKSKFASEFEAKKKELDEISERLRADQASKEKKQIDDLKENLDQRLAVIQISSDNELTALNEQYAKGLIDKDKYEKDKRKIEQQAILDSLNAQLDYYEDLLLIQEAAGIDTTEAQEQIAGLRKQISGLRADTEKAKSSLQEWAEEAEKFLTKVADIYGRANEIISGVLNASTERQKNQIQEQLDLIDQRTAKEIESINQTTANKVEAEAKISIVEKRAAAQKILLEQRQRQLDIQRAQFEKAANIGRITIEGALAVVHQLGSGDPFTTIPRAIIAGALAAAQLAVAIATPIPKFREGKGEANTYEGPAVVGDGGRSELIQREDGSFEVTPAKPTLTWVDKDDIVHPDAQKALKKIDEKDKEQTRKQQEAKTIKESLLYEIDTYHNILSRDSTNISQRTALGNFTRLREEVSKTDITNNETNTSDVFFPQFMKRAVEYYNSITSIISAIKSDSGLESIHQNITELNFPLANYINIIQPDVDHALQMTNRGIDRTPNNSEVSVNPEIQLETLVKEVRDTKKAVVDAIRRKTEHHFHFENPLKKYIRQAGDSWTENLNF